MLVLRVAISIIMLVYTSYFDLRSREVDDKPWIVFSLIGISISLYELIFEGITSDLINIPLSVLITTVISFGLYYLGFYGGADAKALFTLSLVLPLYQPVEYMHQFAPIMVFTNSLILVLILPVYYFAKNVYALANGEHLFLGFESEATWRKAAVMFMGCRLKKVDIDGFYFSLERTVDGVRRFDLSFSKTGDEFLNARDVWGTPGIPLLLFMTVGLITLLLFGDLTVQIIKLLFALIIN